ncbi:ABC transporter substrate-binding protein [Variovorax paradoxus]|nr:ABC transporter substrate-binding protein [Variovorax paradoxus]
MSAQKLLVNRRTACAALYLLSASPQIIMAQVVGRKSRIGFLAEPALDEVMRRAIVEPFGQGLRQFGYIEGKNIVVESRWANGVHERLAGLANELLRLEVDVLVAAFPAAALAAKNATRTVPVVAVSVDNPIAMGLAATFARPGGNITGISGFALEVVAKRLQIMRELMPMARPIGILLNPNVVTRHGLDSAIVDWERTLGTRVLVYEARGPDEFEGVFAAMARDGVGGLVVFADGNTYTHRVRLNELCLQKRMPSVWGGRDFLTGGGLASYQSDFPAMFRRAAALVDKILKGEKPGEIAFEQATKLELVIDRRAVKALGITVPRALYLLANEVIE